MNKSTKLIVYISNKIVFEKSIYILTINTSNGYQGILVDHIATVMSIFPGDFNFREEAGGQIVNGYIFDGILVVSKKEINIYTTWFKLESDFQKIDIEKKKETLQKLLSISKNENSKKNLSKQIDYCNVLLNKK